MGILEDLLRGGGPAAAAAGAPTDAGLHDMLVPAFLAASGDHYVDDSGNFIMGAPDENGMGTIQVDANNVYAGDPRSYNLGPPYTENGLYQGPPPMEDTGLDYSGGGVPMNWQDFSTPTNTSTGGGFFSMDDNFAARGQDLPNVLQSGSSLPSTNNWRLLPPEYRKPNYIMRNGQIIDLNSYMRGPPSLMDSPNGAGTGGNNLWKSGAGLGFPSAWASGPNGWGVTGWPGQIGPFEFWNASP